MTGRDLILELGLLAHPVTTPDLDERQRRMIRDAGLEILRLREAGDALARYMAMEHYPEDCEDECESLAAWRAWLEARRG